MTDVAKFYGDSISGNCYKLQLAAAELGMDYSWQEMNILAGDTRTDSFLAMNPNGRVPLMVLPDGTAIAESNAILCYLADGTGLGGLDRLARARVLQWLFFEQYSHEPYIATSRFIVKYLGSPPDRADDLAAKQPGGYAALDVMEKTLGDADFFANDEFTIADIALYAYTHVAHEGGFDLADYPNIRAWLVRIAGRPRHVEMKPASGGHQ